MAKTTSPSRKVGASSRRSTTVDGGGVRVVRVVVVGVTTAIKTVVRLTVITGGYARRATVLPC